MARPVIGYTTQESTYDILQYFVAFCIFLAGGKPIKLSYKGVDVEEIDGLVIGGGVDIDPALYGAVPQHGYRYDRLRDELEMRWLKKADQHNIPVLAICRGAQFMNIARGGSLHMDVAKMYEAAQYPAGPWGVLFFRKWIAIEPQSLLARIMGSAREKVNSLHRQAIDRVGDGLVISGRERNGVVQAIEDPSRAFYIGVQFHPELLLYRRKHRSFFKELVRAARAVS